MVSSRWWSTTLAAAAVGVMVGGHRRIGGDRGIVVGVGWLSSLWQQLSLLGVVAEEV